MEFPSSSKVVNSFNSLIISENGPYKATRKGDNKYIT
jgi:hypothetical protein